VAAFEDGALQLVIPVLVVAETSYLIGTRLGGAAEGAFLRALEGMDVEAPRPEEWGRIAEIVDEYADFPLGATDASVVALAERLGAEIVATLDHRHFGAIRPKHMAAFRLIP
jgi:uncharacterized protein